MMATASTNPGYFKNTLDKKKNSLREYLLGGSAPDKD